MKSAHYIAMVAAFVLICAGGVAGQTKVVIRSDTALPKSELRRAPQLTLFVSWLRFR
jgi:hypothetical protein